jgi:DNA sulfur modification protein DndE
MNNLIEIVRVSEKAKVQLISLKRKTGIQNWNVLCRWAFCLSIKENSPPPDEVISTDSSIEMSWRTFTGGNEAIYLSLLLDKAKIDKVTISKIEINQYFKLHLHRGISYLNSAPIDSISSYMKMVV